MWSFYQLVTLSFVISQHIFFKQNKPLINPETLVTSKTTMFKTVKIDINLAEVDIPQTSRTRN